MEPVPPPVLAMNTLSITNVDMQVKENSEKHNTARYQYPSLVVRRGESFKLIVTLDNTLPPGNVCWCDSLKYVYQVLRSRHEDFMLQILPVILFSNSQDYSQ